MSVQSKEGRWHRENPGKGSFSLSKLEKQRDLIFILL